MSDVDYHYDESLAFNGLKRPTIYYRKESNKFETLVPGGYVITAEATKEGFEGMEKMRLWLFKDQPEVLDKTFIDWAKETKPEWVHFPE
jgi:hypothetical protein